MPLAAACGAWAAPPDGAAGAATTADKSGSRGTLAETLQVERDTLKHRLEDQQQANAAARDDLEEALRGFRHARAAFALRPETEKEKKHVAEAEARAEKIQKSFRELRISARITAGALKEAEQTEKELASEQSGLDGFVVGTRETAFRQGLIRIGASLLFILGAVVPFSLVRRRRRRERIEQSRKCPRCLNKDTLEFVTPTSDREFDEGQTMFRLKECNYCRYEIRENYIDENRLCFPTVGIRSSGKTHWLLMLYDQIKNSNIPVASAIRKIPSREDQRFDELVQRLLYAGGHLDPTVYGLPHPLTFHVNDADRHGANKSMVNLFDYSGEMRRFEIDTDEFRRRALLCEGFTLFLDPTQASEGIAGLIASQIDCLSKFAEEMHAIRGLPAEVPDRPADRRLRFQDRSAGEQELDEHPGHSAGHRAARDDDQKGQPLAHPRALQLCAMAMTQMFPGWNVERSLRENFGGRYMFFPMSAVGLEEAELGVEDLSETHDCSLRHDRAPALAAAHARLLRTPLTTIE